MKPFGVSIECRKCGASTDCVVYPGRSARTSGPPEDCYPAEPSVVDPERCCWCDNPFPDGIVEDAMEDMLDREEAAAEDHHDAMRDEARCRKAMQ